MNFETITVNGKELKYVPNRVPLLAEDYWDCECEENFIHEKKDLPTCPACNTNHEEQPDSHLNEVMNMTEGGQP